jgi:hypothetical protein
MATLSTDTRLTSSPGRTKAVPKPRGTDWGRIVAEGRAARLTADKGRWRIGTLALLIEKRYAARAIQMFAEEIGESYSTVRRYRWVVKRYDPTVRFRFNQLSFSHFQAVAGHPDRIKWLEKAEKGCWSVDRLTRESRSDAVPGDETFSPDRARAAIHGAAEKLAEISSLPDKEITGTEEWLGPALLELAAELSRLQDRLAKANGGKRGRKPVAMQPYRVRGATRRGNGNGNGAARSNGRGKQTRR